MTDEPILCRRPDDEFLSIYAVSSDGGEWDAGYVWDFEDDPDEVDEEGAEEPRGDVDEMPLRARISMLNVMQGHHLDPAHVRAARTLMAAKPSSTSREIRYALGAQLGIKNDWTLGDAVRHAELMAAGQGSVQQMRSNGYRLAFHNLSSKHCCLVCKRLYFESDGVTPRLFLLDELGVPCTNIGKDLREWLPTVPPLHFNACVHSLEGLEMHLRNPLLAAPVRPRPSHVTRLPDWTREAVEKHFRG